MRACICVCVSRDNKWMTKSLLLLGHLNISRSFVVSELKSCVYIYINKFVDMLNTVTFATNSRSRGFFLISDLDAKSSAYFFLSL